MTSNGLEKRTVTPKEVTDKVQLKTIPDFSKLRQKVDVVLKNSSWWDLYGVDWAIIVVFYILAGVGLLLLRSDSLANFLLGTFLIGWFHQSVATKAGHLAAHGALFRNKKLGRYLCVLCVEMTGQFSEQLTYDAHIKEHHPYTNVIGIGDSSTWKAPFLPRYIYMFIAPLFLPVVTPLVALAGLVEIRDYMGLVKFLVRAGAGLGFQVYLLMAVSGYQTITVALLVLWFARAILSVSYIHVNIFQHIGLPMYSRENRPVRLYQMATCVLNLPSNILLDYAFGHSIISCHVEHHLFPNLSDNMCLKIKPVVSKFLKENGLPYNEKSYTDRLMLFCNKYETLMVNAPPITHFVGIQ